MSTSLNTHTSSNCWTKGLGLSKVKDVPTSRDNIIDIMLYRSRRVYFDDLSESFSRWRRWNQNHSFLSKGTHIQVKLPGLVKDKEWVCGKVCKTQATVCEDTYSVMFDIFPGKIYKGIPRNLIKPLTRLVRSGVIIDWNDIEPPQKQRLVEKWGRRACASDFE
jgi:hypothetical protein